MNATTKLKGRGTYKEVVQQGFEARMAGKSRRFTGTTYRAHFYRGWDQADRRIIGSLKKI